MTKTAQLAVSRGLAQSCAGTGVTVNAVLPGPTRSPGVEEFAAQAFFGCREHPFRGNKADPTKDGIKFYKRFGLV